MFICTYSFLVHILQHQLLYHTNRNIISNPLLMLLLHKQERSSTVAKGYNRFHVYFSKLPRENFNCDYNVQLFNSDWLFLLSKLNRHFQCSTTILTFNRISTFSTLNCDSHFQPRLCFSTLNCNSNFQTQFDFSTLNYDYNFQPQFGFSTLNQDSFQRSTAIQLFNTQLRFQLSTVICIFL